jgi:hypothetical protein
MAHWQSFVHRFPYKYSLAIALNYCWLEVEYFFQEKERVDKYSTTLHSVVGQAASCFDLSQLTYHQVFEYKHYL